MLLLYITKKLVFYVIDINHNQDYRLNKPDIRTTLAIALGKYLNLSASVLLKDRIIFVVKKLRKQVLG